jgi:hypothetical protein
LASPVIGISFPSKVRGPAEANTDEFAGNVPTSTVIVLLSLSTCPHLLAAAWIIVCCADVRFPSTNVSGIDKLPEAGQKVDVGVGVGVSGGVFEGVGEFEGVIAGVDDGVTSGVDVTVGVTSGVDVTVGVAVGVVLGVGEFEGVIFGVGELDGVTFGVGEFVGVWVGVILNGSGNEYKGSSTK